MAEKLTMSPMECCEAFHVVPDGFEPIQMSPPKFKAMCMANRFDWCVPIPMKQDEFLISRAGFYAWLDSFFRQKVGGCELVQQKREPGGVTAPTSPAR